MIEDETVRVESEPEAREDAAIESGEPSRTRRAVTVVVRVIVNLVVALP